VDAADAFPRRAASAAALASTKEKAAPKDGPVVAISMLDLIKPSVAPIRQAVLPASAAPRSLAPTISASVRILQTRVTFFGSNVISRGGLNCSTTRASSVLRTNCFINAGFTPSGPGCYSIRTSSPISGGRPGSTSTRSPSENRGYIDPPLIRSPKIPATVAAPIVDMSCAPCGP
jgi:hypothetical protein